MVRAMRAVEAGTACTQWTRWSVCSAPSKCSTSNGPLFAETDYLARGRVLAISDTPKTEFFWYETTLTDPAEGTDVASMLMMLRFMKASSPLWSSDVEATEGANR